jgi:hypothetical protein
VALCLAGAAACSDTSDAARAETTETTSSVAEEPAQPPTSVDSADVAAPPAETTPPLRATDAAEGEIAGYPGTVSPIVALDESARFEGARVVAEIVGSEDRTVEARLAGESNGPGVALTVSLRNDGSDAAELGTVIVDLIDSTGQSSTLVGSAQDGELGGVLEPGGAQTGTYVFSIPDDARTDVRVLVHYSYSTAAVGFAGSLP